MASSMRVCFNNYTFLLHCFARTSKEEAPKLSVSALQLQQELHKCEKVIDAVVDAHHLGFNHAIENYSKILSLFNECKAQVRSHHACHPDVPELLEAFRLGSS
jgi:hypothetical protein